MSPVLSLLKELVSRSSVTPDDAGILDLVAARLARAGYASRRLDFGSTANLWCWRGGGPYRVVNGHVDVVPPGEGWTGDPWTPREQAGLLLGRGACDMKAGVAASVVALERAQGDNVALLLTSDEEQSGEYGTSAALNGLLKEGVQMRDALVTEPTCEEVLGDFYKPGRRGSVTLHLIAPGVQGHVAYPDRADNAAHRLAPVLDRLVAERWDEGDAYFPPTSMQVFELRAGVGASNVIPGSAMVGVNWRNGPASPYSALRARVERLAPGFEARWYVGCEPFLSPPAGLAQRLVEAVREVTGRTPEPSTRGGTSDARAFAARGIEVVEFGPVPVRMHGADEGVAIADLEPLAQIHEKVIG